MKKIPPPMSLDRQEYLAARIEYYQKKLKLGILIIEKVTKIQQMREKDREDENLTEVQKIRKDLKVLKRLV